MSVNVIAYPDFRFSYNYINVLECIECEAKARLIRILRDINPRTDHESEVRLFECEECGHHQVIEICAK
jgi:Zn ribbon nucleic-acid-binding protein